MKVFGAGGEVGRVDRLGHINLKVGCAVGLGGLKIIKGDVVQILSQHIAFHAGGAHLAPFLAQFEDINKGVAGNAVASRGILAGRAAHLQGNAGDGGVGNGGLFLRGDLLRKAAQWGERHHPSQQQQDKRAKKTLHLNQRLLYSWLGLAEMETAHVIL